mgnify:CR=1 FL=1
MYYIILFKTGVLLIIKYYSLKYFKIFFTPNNAVSSSLAGLLFVLEALSVMIQVVSFKTTGKRVFKMAPLHHHFELCGLKETHVVALFWFFSLICCLVGLIIL